MVTSGGSSTSFTWVIPPKFDSAGWFNEGLAPVRVGDDVSGKWGYVDTRGNVRDPATGKWGYVDTRGAWAIPPQFTGVGGPFVDGLAWVNIDGKFGYIDRKGTIVIAPQFGRPGDFYEGLARVFLNDRAGYIDKSGAFVLSPRFIGAGPFQEGLAAVCVGDASSMRCGYIARK